MDLATKVKYERHYNSVLTVHHQGVGRDNSIFNGIYKQASILHSDISNSVYL
jgi:hypothetical protein